MRDPRISRQRSQKLGKLARRARPGAAPRVRALGGQLELVSMTSSTRARYARLAPGTGTGETENCPVRRHEAGHRASWSAADRFSAPSLFRTWPFMPRARFEIQQLAHGSCERRNPNFGLGLAGTGPIRIWFSPGARVGSSDSAASRRHSDRHVRSSQSTKQASGSQVAAASSAWRVVSSAQGWPRVLQGLGGFPDRRPSRSAQLCVLVTSHINCCWNDPAPDPGHGGPDPAAVQLACTHVLALRTARSHAAPRCEAARSWT